MRKSNIATMLFLCATMAVAVLLPLFGERQPAGIRDAAIVGEGFLHSWNMVRKVVAGLDVMRPVDERPDETQPDEAKADGEEPATQAQPYGEMLFVGDSRTVGLMEYAQLEEADFFCSVGMSVFDIQEARVSVPGVGKTTLAELLDYKKYDKIYIMLGVNELGYEFESILAQYKALLEFLEEKEPEAAFIIHGNLHVTKSRSDSDGTFNNRAINTLNSALAELADNQKIFYLDANVLFDDAHGALSAEKSSDNTHLYAKYYTQWGEWILQQAGGLPGRDNFD